jgi:hypothetical protein
MAEQKKPASFDFGRCEDGIDPLSVDTVGDWTSTHPPSTDHFKYLAHPLLDPHQI